MKLEILDEKTGVCLFEKTWKWPVPGKGYSALCKLIKSLFLIAKSLHAEEVNFVDFDVNKSDRMRLSCVQDQLFLLGVFHSTSDDKESIDNFTLSVKEEFNNIYNNIHESLRAEIDSIVDEKLEPLMTEDEILERFKDFDEAVNKCVKDFFPNHAENQLMDEGVSDTEESDSRKTSESRERKQEEPEDFRLIP